MSVSQLNEIARESLKSCFGPEVWIQGEIHGLKCHAKSGHVYFDLVEKAPLAGDGYIAKVGCAFFKGPYTKWRLGLASMGMRGFELDSGIEVRLKARIDLFVKEGRYQLIVSEIDPAYTFGAIAKKREQTIEALRALRLLDRNKGLRFPKVPLNIGLITSEGSAAFSDFMRIIADSGYSFAVTLFDAHMQGENTVPEVIRGIRTLQAHPCVDTIVIIRGGGAKTDLFSFDDLTLCKAVGTCPKPVVTGIGHEIDISVADLTAHTYCVTPTDAARLYVSRADEVWGFLSQACVDLSYRSRDLMERANERLRLTGTGLSHVAQRWTASALSALKGLAFRLHSATARDLARSEQVIAQDLLNLKTRAAAFLSMQRQALGHILPDLARKAEVRLSTLEGQNRLMGSSLAGHAGVTLAGHQDRLTHLEALNGLLNPSETLRRGYSITVDERGRAVTDASALEEGDRITTQLARGKVKSIVTDKEP